MRFFRAPAALLAAPAVAVLLSGAAAADQLIQIPTADRAAPRAEYRRRVDGRADEGYATLLLPAGVAYEVMFRYYDNEDRRHRIEGGGLLQILPDGVVTPGVALGIWDVTNSGPWGRRAFVVLTKGLEPGQWFVREPLRRVQFTLGAGTGRFGGPLAGLRLDLPAGFSLIGEYDARRFNAGLWLRPIPPLTLKAELQNGNPYLGAAFQLPF